MKNIFGGVGGGGVGNRLIASEKLIKVYLLWPLQGSVRGYIREISVAMFLQIQTDIH